MSVGGARCVAASPQIESTARAESRRPYSRTVLVALRTYPNFIPGESRHLGEVMWIAFQIIIVCVVAYYAEIPGSPNQGFYLGLVSLTAAWLATYLLSRLIDCVRRK